MAFKFFNYAQAAQDAESIKGARLKNSLMGLEVQEETRRQENLAKVDQINQMHADAPARIQALRDAGMHDQANALIESEIKQLQNGVDLAKTMTEGLNADNWKSTRQQLIEVGAIRGEFMPKDYDPSWLRAREREAKVNLQKITRMVERDGEVGMTDELYADGKLVEAGPLYDDDKNRGRKGGGGGSRKFTASDSNAIAKAAANLFDGLYDPATGEFKVMDPTKRPMVMAIASDAERLFREEGLSHRQAVEEAAKQYNIQRPGADPVGIRSFLQ